MKSNKLRTKKQRRTGKRSWKYDLPENAGHIPNKEEAKMVRKLMAETGNTEKEIREIPKYRRMLARAQKSSEKGDRPNRYKRRENYFWKSARQQTGYPNEHPETKMAYKEIYKNAFNTWNFSDITYSKKDIKYFEENEIKYK